MRRRMKYKAQPVTLPQWKWSQQLTAGTHKLWAITQCTRTGNW